jgi:hypothetical protein
MLTRWGSSPTAPWSPWDDNEHGQCDVGGWTDIIQVAAGKSHTVGLKSDGSVVAVGGTGRDWGSATSGDWTDIIQVAAGWYLHTVGLKSDGSVVAVGVTKDGQCNVGDWTDIVQVARRRPPHGGAEGRRQRGRRGKPRVRQCNVADWTDIVQVAAGGVTRWG